MKNANMQYFPMPGDGADVLKQKAENRASAIQGIANGAGPLSESVQPGKQAQGALTGLTALPAGFKDIGNGTVQGPDGKKYKVQHN